MRRTIRGQRVKGGSGDRIKNNTLTFGIMGGLAPTRNVSNSTLRAYHEGHAKLFQDIPPGPVEGLRYMMGDNPLHKYLLSRNPASSGGVGRMIPNLHLCSAKTLVDLNPMPPQVRPLVEADSEIATGLALEAVRSLPPEGLEEWRMLDNATKREWVDAINLAGPLNKLFQYPDNIHFRTSFKICTKNDKGKCHRIRLKINNGNDSDPCVSYTSQDYPMQIEHQDSSGSHGEWETTIDNVKIYKKTLFGCHDIFGLLGLHVWKRDTKIDGFLKNIGLVLILPEIFHPSPPSPTPPGPPPSPTPPGPPPSPTPPGPPPTPTPHGPPPPGPAPGKWEKAWFYSGGDSGVYTSKNIGQPETTLINNKNNGADSSCGTSDMDTFNVCIGRNNKTPLQSGPCKGKSGSDIPKCYNIDSDTIGSYKSDTGFYSENSNFCISSQTISLINEKDDGKVAVLAHGTFGQNFSNATCTTHVWDKSLNCTDKDNTCTNFSTDLRRLSSIINVCGSSTEDSSYPTYIRTNKSFNESGSQESDTESCLIKVSFLQEKYPEFLTKYFNNDNIPTTGSSNDNEEPGIALSCGHGVFEGACGSVSLLQQGPRPANFADSWKNNQPNQTIINYQIGTRAWSGEWGDARNKGETQWNTTNAYLDEGFNISDGGGKSCLQPLASSVERADFEKLLDVICEAIPGKCALAGCCVPDSGLPKDSTDGASCYLIQDETTCKNYSKGGVSTTCNKPGTYCCQWDKNTTQEKSCPTPSSGNSCPANSWTCPDGKKCESCYIREQVFQVEDSDLYCCCTLGCDSSACTKPKTDCPYNSQINYTVNGDPVTRINSVYLTSFGGMINYFKDKNWVRTFTNNGVNSLVLSFYTPYPSNKYNYPELEKSATSGVSTDVNDIFEIIYYFSREVNQNNPPSTAVIFISFGGEAELTGNWGKALNNDNYSKFATYLKTIHKNIKDAHSNVDASGNPLYPDNIHYQLGFDLDIEDYSTESKTNITNNFGKFLQSLRNTDSEDVNIPGLSETECPIQVDTNSGFFDSTNCSYYLYNIMTKYGPGSGADYKYQYQGLMVWQNPSINIPSGFSFSDVFLQYWNNDCISKIPYQSRVVMFWYYPLPNKYDWPSLEQATDLYNWIKDNNVSISRWEWDAAFDYGTTGYNNNGKELYDLTTDVAKHIGFLIK